MSSSKICSCGAEFTDAQSSGKYCFKCKVGGIAFTWRGPTRATKQNFHDHTIASVIREQDQASARAGTTKEMERTGTRWV